MHILPSDRCLWVDVDDTLIMWSEDHTSWLPHLEHIALIKQFSSRGQKIVVWSAGGVEWAVQAINLLELEPYVDLVVSKPAWFIDDLPSSEFLPESSRIFKPFVRQS